MCDDVHRMEIYKWCVVIDNHLELERKKRATREGASASGSGTPWGCVVCEKVKDRERKTVEDHPLETNGHGIGKAPSGKQKNN